MTSPFIYFETGVLVGLAVRTGVTIYMPLPELFYLTLSAGSEDVTLNGSVAPAVTSFARSKRNLINSCALTMRMGILSMVPEVSRRQVDATA